MMYNKDAARLIDAMVLLLESNIGYSISLDAMLAVRPLDDLTFAVDLERYDAEKKDFFAAYEKIFTNAREAVEFFEAERQRLQLGDDIEAELMRRDGLIPD